MEARSISEQKLKEMEDEMNRFEQEIAGPEDVDMRVPRDQDYRVQPPPPPKGEPRMRPPPPHHPQHFDRFHPSGLPPPPPPPPPGPHMSGFHSNSGPPQRFQFIPHQVHRGPMRPHPGGGPMGPHGPGGPYPGPQHMHHMGPGPHMMPGGPYMQPHQFHPMMGPRPMGPQMHQSPAVYAAPPMKPMESEMQKDKKSSDSFHDIDNILMDQAKTIMANFAAHSQEMNALAESHSTAQSTQDESANKKEKKKKKAVRTAGGQVWEDPSLAEWENDDFRIFCGDLGNEVTDEILIRAFSKYPSFLKAKVVREKRSNKPKGYGFVSFKDPQDFIKAMREMNGKYVGSRPIKLRKSSWKDRNLDAVKKKQKEKERLGLR